MCISGRVLLASPACSTCAGWLCVGWWTRSRWRPSPSPHRSETTWPTKSSKPWPRIRPRTRHHLNLLQQQNTGTPMNPLKTVFHKPFLDRRWGQEQSYAPPTFTLSWMTFFFLYIFIFISLQLNCADSSTITPVRSIYFWGLQPQSISVFNRLALHRSHLHFFWLPMALNLSNCPVVLSLSFSLAFSLSDYQIFALSELKGKILSTTAAVVPKLNP